MGNSFLDISRFTNEGQSSAGDYDPLGSAAAALVSANTYTDEQIADLPPSGSALTVTDGTTSVDDATMLTFTGATVIDGGSGNAEVAISGGSAGGYAVFTTSSTWTVPDGVTTARFRVLGGGGGGGAGSAQGGGGAAGLLVDQELAVTAADSLTITIGAGGATQSPGGTSSVADSGTVLITAAGGLNGLWVGAAGLGGCYGQSAQGTTTAGVVVPGSGGSTSGSDATTANSTDPFIAVVGGAAGSSSTKGGGAQQANEPLAAQLVGTAATADGQTATMPGCGGGGSAGAGNGGAGADGQVEVWY